MSQSWFHAITAVFQHPMYDAIETRTMVYARFYNLAEFDHMGARFFHIVIFKSSES